MRSFLRWAGSKRLSLPKLRQFWTPAHNRYIEPFAGSACLFFDLEPSTAVLGDLNWELITTLREIRRDVYLVLECLRRLRRGKRHYYRIRALDPRILAPADLAARFLYLNRFCFNGLYRTNMAGSFNVPYRHPGGRNRFDEEALIKAAKMLERAELLHGDFEETAGLAESGDFVYLDPPYVMEKRRVFSEYTAGSFRQTDLARVGALLSRLDRTGVDFLITYADCAEARDLLGRWRPRRVWVRRNIAGFTGHRRGYYGLPKMGRFYPVLVRL